MPVPTTAITFTLDLEDHRPSEAPAGTERYPELTRRVLDFLGQRGVRGTFFVVGEVAQQQPDLVRDIAQRGHELGLHSWRHVPLTELDPDHLRRDAKRGKQLLEELGGKEVHGFRAPIFSIVPESRWAVGVLAGFSERFVPDMLTRSADTMEATQKKPAGPPAQAPPQHTG